MSYPELGYLPLNGGARSQSSSYIGSLSTRCYITVQWRLKLRLIPAYLPLPAPLMTLPACHDTCEAWAQSNVQANDAWDCFAFARIKDEVCLVQSMSYAPLLSLIHTYTGPVSSHTPLSPLTPVDVRIFSHEFISMFRVREIKTLHPTDVSIIQRIDDLHAYFEEESGMVVLAREVVGKMSVKPVVVPVQSTAPRRPRPSQRSRYQAVRYA